MALIQELNAGNVYRAYAELTIYGVKYPQNTVNQGVYIG